MTSDNENEVEKIPDLIEPQETNEENSTDNIPALIDPPHTNDIHNDKDVDLNEDILSNVNPVSELPFSKQIVKYKLKDSNEWHKCVILNRWGNFPNRRKCKHVLNIRHLDDNSEKCIDWIDSVDEWEPLQENVLVASCMNSEINKDEFIEEKLLLTSDKAYDEAKETELQNWVNMQVYDQVDDHGQDYVTVNGYFWKRK